MLFGLLAREISCCGHAMMWLVVRLMSPGKAMTGTLHALQFASYC